MASVREIPRPLPDTADAASLQLPQVNCKRAAIRKGKKEYQTLYGVSLVCSIKVVGNSLHHTTANFASHLSTFKVSMPLAKKTRMRWPNMLCQSLDCHQMTPHLRHNSFASFFNRSVASWTVGKQDARFPTV